MGVALNPKLNWYISRSSGLVALALITASVLWGLAVSGRFTKKLPPPAWTLDLHRFLGGLSVTFTFVHVISLWMHHYIKFGWKDLFIPFYANGIPYTHATKMAVAWGVIGFWILIAVEATSLMMKRLPRRLWRYVHLSSFGLFVLALVHGVMAGTDANKPQVKWAILVSTVLTVLAFFLRLKLPKWRKARRDKNAARRDGAPAVGRSFVPPAPPEPIADATAIHSPQEEAPSPEDRAARIAAIRAAREQK